MSETEASTKCSAWLGWKRIVSVFLLLLLPIAFTPVSVVLMYADAAALWIVVPGTFMTTLMATGFIVGMGIALSEPEESEKSRAPVVHLKSTGEHKLAATAVLKAA